MSVVVGVSPTKLLPFNWMAPNTLILEAVRDEFLINVLLFILQGLNGL
jgi:hypothetical protein